MLTCVIYSSFTLNEKLHTFSPLPDCPGILPVPFLIDMSAILVQRTFEMPSILFIMFTFLGIDSSLPIVRILDVAMLK
jgi:hypothetical protein